MSCDLASSEVRHRISTTFLAVCAFAVPVVVTSCAKAGARNEILGFDVSNATIPVAEIRSGGPPRDGIPSIDRPKFIPANSASFMKSDDLVVSVTIKKETRAYPLRILVWHEIVNDTLGGRPIAVTYCPLCGTAMVFDRRFGNDVLEFGVSGLLFQSDVLMYDRSTESLWSQLGMHAVTGSMAGTPLAWLAGEHMTWSAWTQRYPDGEVLSTFTGHQRDYTRMPYEGYEDSEQIMFPVPRTRTELPNKARVAGVIVNGESRAYPLDMLPPRETVLDPIGGDSLRVWYDPAAREVQISRSSNGRILPTVQAYWFAWQAFYPGTSLWMPPTMASDQGDSPTRTEQEVSSHE